MNKFTKNFMNSPLCIIIFLTIIPIKSEILSQRQIAEFDVTTEEQSYLAAGLAKKLAGKLETQLGRSYEVLGHKLSDFSTQLEQNKNDLTEKATEIYTGPLADKTSSAYEKFQYGYGQTGDGLSSLLKWLGQNVIRLGHRSGSMIRTGFHTVGDLIGDTVDKTENFVGNELIKSGEQVHVAAIDLQRTSHNDSDLLRRRIQQSAPDFERSVYQAIDSIADKIHAIGTDTETAGEVLEQHHFLDTVKQAYHNFK